MTRICWTCGGTDENVYFASTVRASGYNYTHIRCSGCQHKRKVALKNGTAKPIQKEPKWEFKKNTIIEVLKCPNNEYPVGNYFYSGGFHNTLLAGYWTLGMVVLIEGKKYAVCGNGIVMKTMKKLGYPLDVRLPAQWLTEVI